MSNTKIHGNLTIVPTIATDIVNIGTEAKRFNELHVKNVFADNLVGSPDLSGSKGGSFTVNSDSSVGVIENAVLTLKSSDGTVRTGTLTLLAAATPKFSLSKGLDIASGSLTVGGANVYNVGGADVAVADGGTGASTAAQARTNLGLAIGADVQAYSASLTAFAGMNAAAAATSFGLGAASNAVLGSLTLATGGLTLATSSAILIGDDEQFWVGYNGIDSCIVRAASGSLLLMSDEPDRHIAFKLGTSVGGNGTVAIRNANNSDLFTVQGNGITTFNGTMLCNNLVREGAAKTRIVSTLVADTTLNLTHNVVRCDASGGAFIVTLPTAAGMPGLVYTLKKVDATANIVTLKGNGAELIDGSNTNVAAMAAQFGAITVVSNGASWDII